MSKKPKVIYGPKGKAAEYCKLAVNTYKGCSHGCLYCYVPGVLRVSPEGFHCNVQVRKNVLLNLKNDLRDGEYKDKKILMCFTTDPYQPIEKTEKITQQSLELMGHYSAVPVILTKNSLALRDLDLIKNTKSWLGYTLTHLNNRDSQYWEPEASLPSERITVLKKAKAKGINTWVSLEPVIDVVQTLEIIKKTKDFVDLYKVGKLNYNSIASLTDWHEFYYKVTRLLKESGKKFYIKEDLRNYAGEKYKLPCWPAW